MLDQNTDRMWYVIGALVVGAGIILLANKTMPEVLASVGGMFDDVISTISIENEPYNMIAETVVHEGLWVVNNVGSLSSSSNGENHAVTDYIQVRPGREYEFVMADHVKTNMRLAYYDSNYKYISGDHEYGNYLLTKAPYNARYIRLSGRFREGNGYSALTVTDYSEWYFGWYKQ